LVILPQLQNKIPVRSQQTGLQKNVEANSTVGWVGSAGVFPILPFSAQEIDARFTESRVGISLPAKIIERMVENEENNNCFNNYSWVDAIAFSFFCKHS
jgi:hypothetical protein